MVKLGFIVEGDTEALILKSAAFKTFLISLGLQLAADPINVKERTNLMPDKIESDVATLMDLGSNTIFLFTDLDEDKCITLTKNRIDPNQQHTTIIGVKEIESWFLADTNSLRAFLKSNDLFIENPESVNKPSDHINSLRSSYRGRKARSKVVLANEILSNGFTIESAAQHPNCSSARYFIQKLEEAASLKTLIQ
jgi:hypothetical protein